MKIRTFVAKSRTFVSKPAICFPKMRGDQRPFSTFPKIHPFWFWVPSLTSVIDLALISHHELPGDDLHFNFNFNFVFVFVLQFLPSLSASGIQSSY